MFRQLLNHRMTQVVVTFVLVAAYFFGDEVPAEALLATNLLWVWR